jgi:hypothetical protein
MSSTQAHDYMSQQWLAHFFAGWRVAFRKLSSTQQVEGIEWLLAQQTQAGLDGYPKNNLALDRWQHSYVLATIHWETGTRMQPCREAPNSTEEWRAKHLRYWPYYGRGYVQITHKYNYAYARELTGLDCVEQPDLVLDKRISYMLCVHGMLSGQYGRPLGRYVDKQAGRKQYTAARQSVNGKDKAAEIAAIAREYEKLLTQASTLAH